MPPAMELGSMSRDMTTIRKLTVTLLGLVAALAQQSPARCEPESAPLPPDAAKVARDFLYAFSRNDRETIRGMLPTELSNLYGPCPFAEPPDLSRPRVRKRAGAVNFTGRMVDRGLPTNGMIVLRRVEEDGVRTWRVRQIYWYDKLPGDAKKMRERSASEADREQEAQIERAASEFIDAWLAEGYEKMDELTFHWWEVDRRRSKWIKLARASFENTRAALDGLCVDFVAKLKIAKIFSRRVSGNIWLVQEDGEWRVRPVSLTLQF